MAKRLQNGGIARNSEEAYVLLLSRVGIRPQLPAANTYEDAMARLADLIEPEERVGALPGRRGPWSAGRRVSRVRSDEPGGGPCAAHVGE